MTEKKITGIVYVILVLIIGFLGITIYELYDYSQTKEEAIGQLTDEVGTLEEELSAYKNLTEEKEYTDDGFNYLALGNSITKHGISDYWWSICGMAASSADKDYVHLIASHFENEYDSVCFYAMNYYMWETQANDRAETYVLIDPYLSEDLDLVTIQLSENVSDYTTYEQDYEELIRYIEEKAPNAKIVVIDDFWSSGNKSTMKREAAENTGVGFADLEEIKNDPEYQCGMGTTVYDDQGGAHILMHEKAATHPGDKGMQYIADAVLTQIGEQTDN